MSMNIHTTQTHSVTPVRGKPGYTPRKTIPKFSSKLRYGHESQLEARGQDGMTD